MVKHFFMHLFALVLLTANSNLAWSAGDAELGQAVAQKWCATCHLVSDNQTTASADVPTFRSIAAKYDDNTDALAAFLADPHPPMPSLSLTWNQIRDLVAYIGSQR
ncbi:MAG: c-type cytochrome [Pseudomonadota bacterium]